MKNTMKKTVSLLLAVLMIAGIFAAMPLTAYAAEYTSLQQGDVLHLGDTINTSTAYMLSTGNWLTPNTWTLVRGNITGRQRNVNESDFGAYYFLKSSSNVYVDIIRQGEGFVGCWPVSDTSDGIYVESLSGSNVKFAVHEASAHTHDFTYSASGATITATCGEGCDITEGLTLTISAPTGDLTADGSKTFPATLNDDYNTTAFPGTYTIVYTKDGQPYDGTPTEAGAYTASVTVGTATASVSYTVAAPTYIVTWNMDDGSLIDTTEVEAGVVPTHTAPTKDADAQYTYTFAGWNDGTTTYAPDADLPEVTGEATYTATFSTTVNEYTITWKNDDSTVIDTTTVAYGETPTHADATKESDAQYNYIFKAWTPEIEAVKGDAEYTATFDAVEKILLGDVDGDGEVSIIDVTWIQRKLASMDVKSYNEKAADVDGDKDVSIVDATYIQRYLANIAVDFPIDQLV